MGTLRDGGANAVGEAVYRTVKLVLAGGYDPRVAENVEYHRELTALAQEQV